MIKHYKELIEFYESKGDYSQTAILKGKIASEIDNLKDYKQRKKEEYFWNSVIRNRKEEKKSEVKEYRKRMCYGKIYDMDKPEELEEIERLSEIECERQMMI